MDNRQERIAKALLWAHEAAVFGSHTCRWADADEMWSDSAYATNKTKSIYRGYAQAAIAAYEAR